MKHEIAVTFSAKNPQNQLVDLTYSHTDFGSCLDRLTFFVRFGWQLVSVDCFYAGENTFSLPVDAFDEKPIRPAFKKLQREWESILEIS